MVRTESNSKPEQVEIRKLEIIDGEPRVYLYLNGDIKQAVEPDMDGEPRTMYRYDMNQITTPIPPTLLPEIDIKLIARHDTNQTTTKQKTRNHLDDIKQTINNAAKQQVKHVDRLDKLTDITDAELENIREHIKPETKQL